ncbi:MAG: MarR family transcriptional regulator [Pseudomonadota bacterium]|nr:MarR family transcriptional regulator [Pseudomonadota bacterium]
MDLPVSDLQLRFSSALHTTARAWRQALDVRLKDLGVSQAGWMTIAMVAKSASAPSQKQLADLLGVEGPTVVAMVDRLVGAGLVERAPSPLDRRVKLIRLTAAGQALYGTVKTRADVFRIGLLSEVDAATLLAATTLLESLQARIEAPL